MGARASSAIASAHTPAMHLLTDMNKYRVLCRGAIAEEPKGRTTNHMDPRRCKTVQHTKLPLHVLICIDFVTEQCQARVNHVPQFCIRTFALSAVSACERAVCAAAVWLCAADSCFCSCSAASALACSWLCALLPCRSAVSSRAVSCCCCSTCCCRCCCTCCCRPACVHTCYPRRQRLLQLHPNAAARLNTSTSENTKRMAVTR